MNTRQDLLDAIRRNRADDLPRLMFADYLDGEADPREPERAEFIRLQCELVRCRPCPATIFHPETDMPREHPWKRGGPPIIKPKKPCGRCPVCQLRRRERELIAEFNSGVLFPGDPPVRPLDDWWDRGFLKTARCSWDDWSANAAAILPLHPGLERVVLTTPPVIEYRTYEREERNRIATLGLEALAAGMKATAERAVSVIELRSSNLDLLAYTREQLRHDLRPESVLASFWGGNPAKGKWGVSFKLPRPDAHGGQYRHWAERRDDPINLLIEGEQRQDAAAVERILRDLLDEHGITEDDLRAGRREVTRLTTTDGRPPTVMMCDCRTAGLIESIRWDDRDLEERMRRQIQTLQLRDRRWQLGGPSERTRRYYRVADAVCPSCNRLYFAVTREERR